MFRTNHWLRICFVAVAAVLAGCLRTLPVPDSGDDCIGDTCRVDSGNSRDARVDVAVGTDVIRVDVGPSVDTGSTGDIAIIDVRADTRTDVAADVRDVIASDSGPIAGFDAPTAAHIRDVVARGRALGNRSDVFSKLGDSITESASFLGDFGYGSGWYDLGSHGALMPALTLFSTRTLRDSRNSFNRQSLCATAGWTAANAIAGGASSALVLELEEAHPLFAIAMYGTNDLDRFSVTQFVANMRTLIDMTETRGTLPILSTIPNRRDSIAAMDAVPNFNAAIRSLASERHLPLIEFNAALVGLPDEGLNADGIHPSAYFSAGFIRNCNLTTDGLEFGYVQRNLTALEMLDRLRAF